MNPRAVQGDTVEDPEWDEEALPEVMSIGTQTCKETVRTKAEIKKETIINNLRAVYQRTDPEELWNITYPGEYDFRYAFYNTKVVSSRTPLTPTGERVATLADVVADFRRGFVLYVDILKSIEQLDDVCEEDKMKIAKSRFAAFYWWLCSTWSAQAGCNGVCYANGSYHPAVVEEMPRTEGKLGVRIEYVEYMETSRDPNTEMINSSYCGVSQKSLENLVEPLKRLDLSDEERMVGAVMVILADRKF